MATLDDALRTLDPPPGGLAAVRARIAAEAAPRRRWLPWLAALGSGSIVAAAGVLAVMLPRAADRPPGWLDAAVAAGDPGLVALGLADPAVDPVSVPAGLGQRVAIRRVETAVPGVLYYRTLADLPGKPAPDAAP